MTRHHRPGRVAAPSAATPAPVRPRRVADAHGSAQPAPNPRAHRPEPLPGQRKPPRPPKVSARLPGPRSRPAVLVYRLETGSYLANMNGTDWEFQLFSQPRPLPANVPVFPLLYWCRPQRRYTDKNQCEAMLQSPGKVLLSGLRVITVPPEVSARAGAALAAVADYNPKPIDRARCARTVVALYGKPGRYDTPPGWLVLLVSERPYSPRHREANARAALGLLRDALPDLPGWLAPLLAGEVGPCEVPEVADEQA